MNTIDYRATMRVKPATRVSMCVNAYTRMFFCACEMRVKHVSHMFSVELVAGLYHIMPGTTLKCSYVIYIIHKYN